jgi:hypothetical protein
MQFIAAPVILDALDEAAARGDFPTFDNMNVDYISSRLTVYRGDAEWALVFNSIAWMGQALGTVVEPIGEGVQFTRTSGLGVKAFQDDPEVRRLSERLEQTQRQGFIRALFSAFKVTGEMREMLRARGDELAADALRARQAAMAAGVTEDHKFMSPGEIEIDYAADQTATVRSISVRGRSVPLSSLTVQEQPHLHTDPGFWIAVALVEQHRDELLATHDEVARFFPRGLPPELLVVDEWRHVDLSGDEKPSQSETFQMLANVIAVGDPSLYKPTEQPNTHWSNWLPK